MFSEQDLILTANQRLENLGGLYGKKTLHLSSENVCNAGEIISTEGEAILESEGIFENTATGRCQGQTVFSANLKALKNAGVLHSEQRLTLKTKASLENLASGKISSRAGTLVASPLCIANHGYIESLGEVVGEAPQIILGTSGRIASNEPLILTAEHFIENAGNLLGKKVLLSVTDKKAGCVRNLETGRVVGVESLDLQVAKLEQTGRLESGQNIIFTGNTFSHVKGTIETGRNLQVTAVDIGVTATAKAVGDIHLIHQGGKWEVSEAVQAQGTLIFYLPDKKIHVIDKPFHSKAGSLCYRSRHSGNALSFLANQQAKADFAFEGFSEVTIGSQTHKPTLLAGGVLSAAVAQLDFHQGRLLSEKGMRLKSAGAMVLGRVSTTFEAAIQSHGTIELEAGKNIDWHSLNLVTEGHLRVKGTILDDISSDVYVRGDVNLEVPLSRHRLLVESHVEQPYPYAPSGGKPFWRRNPWIPRMKAGLDGWHSCPVNWSAFECRRRLEGKMRATTRPAKLMMGGALHYSGQLEVFGSQIACASLKGIAPKISHCIPYESYRRASLCGHRKRRKAHWEYHQSPEVTFGAPILGAVSVASNLKVTAQRVDISGILSALSIGITGIEQGRIGQFEAFVNLGPMVSRPFRNQVPLLDYFEPSPLYEISLGGPTLFKSVLPRGVTPMIPRLVLRSDGTLSPNTAGLSRLFTPEQEVMLLTKSLMGELGRHFLSRELSDTNHILQYLESNALQYSAQNKRLTQASGVSEPAMMVRSSGKSHAIEIQRKGSATTVSSVLPNPCLVDQVITFMFEDGQTVSCLVPVLYLPNRFNNPRLKDSAGCLFSLGDIELSGTPGAQLHLRGNMDAEGLVTYQDFEVVSRTRNTWTRYETIIHESKQKRLTGSKTTTTEELVAITELQSGNALVAKGERYLNVNVVHRSAVKDTLGSEGLVVKNATAFVDEGIVRNQIGPRISVKQKGCLGLGSTEVSRTLVRQQVLGSEIETAGPIRIEAQYGQLDATQIHRVKNAEGVEPKIIFEIAELHFHELLQAVAANNRASERLLLSSLQEQARTAKRKAIQGMTKLVISLPVAYYTSGFISSYLQGSMGVTMKVATVSATVPLATTPQAMTIVGLSGLGAGLTSSLVVGANPLKGAVQRGLSSLVGYGVANASLLAGHEVVQEVVRGSVVGSVSAVMNHQDVLSSLLIGGVASGVGSWVFSGENPDLLSTQIGKSLLEGEVAVVASNGTLEDLAMNLMSSSLGAWMGKSISDIGSRHGASLGLQTSMEIIPAVPVKKKERSFGYAETQSQSLSYWDAITLVTEDAWSQLAKQGHFVSRERIREAFEEHPVLQGNPEHIPAKLELLGRAAPPHGVRLSRTEAIQRGVGKVFNATLALVAGEAQASSTEKFYYSRGSNFKVTDLFTQGSSVSHSTDIWREGLPSVSVATSTQNRATSKVMRFQNLESAVQETTRILKAQGVRVSREKVVQVLTTHPDLKVPNQTIDDRLIELGYINGKIEGMPKSSREAFNRGLENFIRYNQESFTTSARHQEVREQTLLQRDSGNLSSNPLSKSSRHRSDLGTGLRRGAAHAFINTLNTLTPEAQALEVNIRHKQSPKGLDCRLVALKSLWSSDNPEILASCQRQNRTTMPTLAYGADALHLAREEIQVGERVLGGLQAATGIGQMGLGLAIAVVPGVGPVVGTGLGTLGADNVMSGLQTVTTGKPAPTLLFRGLQKVGEKTELYGSMGAAYLEMGVNLTSPAATPKVVEGAGKALTFAFRPGVKASPRAPEIFSEVSLVQKSLQTTTTPSSLTMWDRFRQISTSSPGEIAWGYGNLSSKQAKILLELPTPGSIVQLHKSHITVTDLAALTAKTGDEFAMFTLGSRRLIVRGNSFGLRIEEELLFKFQSEGWTWSAHVHPGTKDIVLNASGIPGDRNALILFEQSQSLILNSTGRRNLFNLTDDIRITPKTDNSHNVFPKNPGSNKQ